MKFWIWLYNNNAGLRQFVKEFADAQTKKRISKYQKTQTTLAKKPKVVRVKPVISTPTQS